MVLTKTKAGYMGLCSDSMGMLNKDTPLAQIKLDGDKLTFKFPLADGNLIMVNAKVEGDKMTGSWTHQEAVAAPCPSNARSRLASGRFPQPPGDCLKRPPWRITSLRQGGLA